ncbi:MAG: hypothetical protein OEU36_04065, partial [Gammaproteobacteria bacterium]|nr:hypothetical protein [Gammaproteobacteria bacterium]
MILVGSISVCIFGVTVPSPGHTSQRTPKSTQPIHRIDINTLAMRVCVISIELAAILLAVSLVATARSDQEAWHEAIQYSDIQALDRLIETIPDVDTGSVKGKTAL